MRIPLFSLLLMQLACAGPEAPHPQLPAPGPTFALSGKGLVFPGDTLEFEVWGATPRTRIFLLADGERSLGSTCPPGGGGACLDLPAPTLAATATTDRLGRARFVVRVPSQVPPGSYYFQAYMPRGTPAVSAVVPRVRPHDGDGVLLATAWVYVDRSFHADRGKMDVEYLAYRIDEGTSDLCRLRLDLESAPSSALPPCAQCDYAFDLEITSMVETSVSGDCRDFFTIYPSGWPLDTAALRAGGAPGTYGGHDLWLYDSASSTWLLHMPEGFVAGRLGTYDYRWSVELEHVYHYTY